MPRLFTIIKQLPLFASLSWWDQRFITEHSKIVEYKKGDIIYKEGDLPDSFYYIISGRAQIFAAEQTLEYVRRGDYFGIISLLTGESHSVSTKVVNDSIILKIEKDDFDAILKRIPNLAIHFSRTLSRRLKRKDLHTKTIFESTIISVYSPKPELGCSWYTINLGLSLKKETQKKVILVDISQTGKVLFNFLDAKDAPLEKIYNHPLGIDIMGFSNLSIDPSAVSNILTLLTNDYHYILVDLPHEVNEVVFKALTQADLVHIIFDPKENTMAGVKNLLSRLEDTHNRVKLCLVSEYMKARSEEIERRLGHDLYATITHDGFIKEGEAYKPSVISQPHTAYSRTIRRIAREIGEVLVGLALSSGAAFGLAHIGVIKVLEEEDIPIDVVVGSSMGGLIGVFWASGKNAKEMEEIAMKYRTRWTLFKLLTLTLPRYGFISGRGVMRFLRTYLGKKTFHDVTLPVKVMSCDIVSRERVVIEHGYLADAVRATISIPGVFKPFIQKDRMLVDGAILSPVPVDVLTEMGIKKIIAVNVIPSPEEVAEARHKLHTLEIHEAQALKKKSPFNWLVYMTRIKFRGLFFPNIIDIIMNSMHAMEYVLAEMSCAQADIVIRPTVPTANWFEFFNPERIIKRGEEEARKAIPHIKAILYE